MKQRLADLGENYPERMLARRMPEESRALAAASKLHASASNRLPLLDRSPTAPVLCDTTPCAGIVSQRSLPISARLALGASLESIASASESGESELTQLVQKAERPLAVSSCAKAVLRGVTVNATCAEWREKLRTGAPCAGRFRVSGDLRRSFRLVVQNLFVRPGAQVAALNLAVLGPSLASLQGAASGAHANDISGWSARGVVLLGLRLEAGDRHLQVPVYFECIARVSKRCWFG